MASIQVTNIADFQQKLERFEREFRPAMRRALADITHQAHRLALSRCPVVTGETRSGIRARVGQWRAGRLTGVVYPNSDVAKWINAVERRHGMFRSARLYGKRNLAPHLQAALDRLIRDIFGN